MDEQELIIAEANKRLLALDLSINSNQPAMKSIVTDLNLEIDGSSAAKLREVLTHIKESLSDEIKEPIGETKEVEKVVSSKGDFIMKVGHLAWGLNNKNHFFADKKPLINAKVMGKYSDRLKIWLDKNWIEKGSYK
jgi:hypothetical protein